VNDRWENAILKRIQRGAVAHYEDAAYYDLAYRRRREDVRFYVAMAEQYGGPVLELGVGTGRVALATARAGIEVVGVEPVPAMLTHAREQAEALPAAVRDKLSLRKGDARSLRLKRRFALITAPFNVFMHLYTRKDVERALHTVALHLAKGGRFVFDVSMPDLHAMTRTKGRLYKGPSITHPRSKQRYDYFEAFEYEPVLQVQMVSMVFQNTTDLGDMKTAPLSQRQFFPRELEALLHYNGFKIERLWGDFKRSPLTPSSESQIIVAKRV
jgi:SAM-dependent methyltransferase